MTKQFASVLVSRFCLAIACAGLCGSDLLIGQESGNEKVARSSIARPQSATGSARPADARALEALIGSAVLAEDVFADRRRAARVPHEQRYEFLCDQILPSETRSEFRVAGAYLPKNTSSLLASDQALRPHSHLPALSDNGSELGDPARNLVSPVYDLLDVAEQENKLSELLRRITSINAESLEARRSKVALMAMIETELGEFASAESSVALLLDSLEEAPPQTAHAVWTPTLVVGRLFDHRDRVENLAELLSYLHVHFVIPGRSLIPEFWQSNLHSMHARDWKRQWTKREQEDLGSWIPVGESTAFSRGSGYPKTAWASDGQGAFAHLGGSKFNYLLFPSPLLGGYTLETNVATYQVGQVLNSGQFTGPYPTPDRIQRGKLGTSTETLPLEPPIAKRDRVVRYRIDQKDGREQAFLVGRKIDDRVVEKHAAPWVGMRSWFRTTAQFHDVCISGAPEIPDQLRLSDSSELSGWIPYYSAPSGTQHAHWRSVPVAGETPEIVGARTGPWGAHDERLLRYIRPMADQSEIEFEFFFNPGESNCSPALDRLVLTFSPHGVVEHWVTDGKYDRTGLRPENSQLVAGNQRHGDQMPLRAGEWNRVRLKLAGLEMKLFLNDRLVYERGIRPDNDRTFGLFHFADVGTARIRNVVMRGNWPRKIPQDLRFGDAVARMLDERLPELTSVFRHDFRDVDQTERYFEYKSGTSGQTLHVEDGLLVTSVSGGTWAQCGAASNFAVHGDFDVTTRFSRLKFPENVKMARLSLLVKLGGDPARHLISAMSFTPQQRSNAMGSVNLLYADGAKQYLTGRQIDESNSGRLRVARRGKQIYFLMSQGDSQVWRSIYQETATDGDVAAGDIQLWAVANGNGMTTVVFNEMTLRAERMTYKPAKPSAPMLSVFASDGSGVRDVAHPSSGLQTIGSPDWSPDGSRIAYDESAGSVQNSRLMVLEARTGKKTDIGYGSMPTFSPDGKRIAFTASGQGLGISNADGSGRRILTRNGWGIQWSPDPNVLAYGNGGQIYLYDLRTNTDTPVFTGAAANRYNYLYWNLCYSDDGKHIAFKGRRRSDGGQELAVVTLADPGQIQVVVPNYNGNPSFCWAGDGEKILYPSVGPESKFFVVDRRSGRSELLSNQPDGRQLLGLDRSDDGKWYAMISRRLPVPQDWKPQE